MRSEHMKRKKSRDEAFWERKERKVRNDRKQYKEQRKRNVLRASSL